MITKTGSRDFASSRLVRFAGWGLVATGVLIMSSRADEAPADVRLTLTECVDAAIEQNLKLKVDRFGPVLATEDLEVAKAPFDPRVEIAANAGESKSALASSELQGSAQPASEQSELRASAGKQFAPGTQIRFDTSLSDFDTDSEFATLNPTIDTRADLSVTQPLLQGGGRLVNTAPIRRGEIVVRRADETLRAAVMDVALETELAYWGLALAYARLEVDQSSLDLSRSLLEETEAMAEQGLRTNVDVIQSRSDVAARMEAVILDRQRIDDTQDELWVLLGRLHQNQSIRLVGDPWPEPDMSPPSVVDSYETALQLQPEYRILKNQIEEQELDVAVARRQNLPALDLSASGGFSGRDDNRKDSYDGLFARDGYNWQVDLTFKMPWGLRETESRLHQARYRLVQGRLSLFDADQLVLRDVRAGCRAVQAGIERVRVTRLSRELNGEQVRQERARFEAGLATVRNVLDAQDDLGEARIRVLEAERDTIGARIRLARLEGSLLQAYGVAWNEIDIERPGDYDRGRKADR